MKKHHVAMASAQPVMHAALRQLVIEADGVEIVGEAATWAEAQALCVTQSPDVLLFDAALCGSSLPELVTYMNDNCPETCVILLTDTTDIFLVREAVRIGARGVLDKQVALQEIVDAIRTVARGGMWLSRQLIQQLIEAGFAPPTDEILFTNREREVLQRLARGWPNLRIADNLGITERTVRAHLRSIYDKIEVESRAEAIVWAVQRGYHRE